MTDRIIFYARGASAFSDDRQRERCMPTLRFLLGDEGLLAQKDPVKYRNELPPGMVEVIKGGGGNGGIHWPSLVGGKAYDDNLAHLWRDPANVPPYKKFDWLFGDRVDTGPGKLDFLILEQDVRPRNYAQLSELFDCEASEVCVFAVEAHREHQGAPPAGPKPCTFGKCWPWSTCISEKGLPLDYPGEWARQSGLGMLRIRGTLPARHPRPDWPDLGDWRTLDSRFTPWLTGSLGVRIHVHWDMESPTGMIRHNHGKCAGDL